MAFSGALTLTDLNDFITPSQACIKPVEQTNKVVKDLGAATTSIHVDANGSYYEVAADGVTANGQEDRRQQKLATAEISLNDCLACSGCITSAESVLITLQSHTEVLNFLRANRSACAAERRIPVFSIAPQSLASLAASVSSGSAQHLSLRQVLRRVQRFCTDVLGVAHVFDTTFARHISLLEHAREFMERKRAGPTGAEETKLPMLASACPGWVCYAEKTHAEMLPFISRTKSPQQVMGTLVKEYMGRQWGKFPDQIYHVTIMPCYDKKLEASRQDFYNEAYATRDVDCVITTGELQRLMEEHGWDLSVPVADEHLPAPSAPPSSSSSVSIPELIMHPGSSSGSYLQSVIAAVATAAPDPSALQLTVRAVRGADYEEHVLTDRASGATVFRGATCYGFRNLQNVVRKVGRDAGVQTTRGAAGRLRGRTRKAASAGGEEKGYDYVEVMACPGGCVNGGGQIRPPVRGADAEGLERDWAESGVRMLAEEPVPAPVQAKWGDREWTKKVEGAYWHSLPTPPPSPPPSDDGSHGFTGPAFAEADRLAARVLGELCKPVGLARDEVRWERDMDDAAEAKRRALFRTQYRAVESEVVGLAVQW